MSDDLEGLDQKLREYGARWRASIPTAAVPPLDAFGPARSRSARLLVPAAAAAVVVVLAGVALGTGRGPRDGAPATEETPAAPSSAAPGVPEVVTWAPLDPTRPDLPRMTTAPSPDPAVAASAPSCRAGDLRAASMVEGAAGTFALNVTIRPASPDVSCRLAGRPAVQFLDQGQLVEIPTNDRSHDSVYRDPVLVAPGSTATLSLYWGSSWCADPVRNDRIRVSLESGSIEVDGFGSSPGCYGTPGSGPNAVAVGTFQPGSPRPAAVTSAYRGVDGRLAAASDPVPGEELRFLVTLTARRGDVSLDPCPDYSMAQYASGGDTVDVRFGLNCAAVPYRDADGVPYLPEGVPVRFEMRLTLLGPDVVAAKSLWKLEASDGPVLAIPTGGG